MKRKVLIIALCMLLTLSFISTGCVLKSGETKGQTSAEVSAEEPVTFTIMVKNATIPVDTPVQKYLEEKLNIKIKIVRSSQDDNDFITKLSLLTAAGSPPDLFDCLVNINTIQSQGLIEEIPIELWKEKAPISFNNYIKAMEEVGIDPYEMFLIDGKNYTVRGLPARWDKINISHVWRGDLLKQLGFNEPPKTVEEIEQIAIAQKKKDPSIYTFGGEGREYFFRGFMPIFNAFSYASGYYIYDEKKGEIVLADVLPETKECLRLLARWYKEGYIDPEWITDDEKAYRTKFYNGKILTMGGSLGDAYPNANFENCYKIMKQVNPNAEMWWGPWLTTSLVPNSTPKWETWMPVGYNMGTCITSSLKNDAKKLDKFFELREIGAQNTELMLVNFYGIEGVHWEWDKTSSVKRVKLLDLKTDASIIGKGLGNPLLGANPEFQDIVINSERDEEYYAWRNNIIGKYKDILKEENLYYDARVRQNDEWSKLWSGGVGKAIVSNFNDIIIGRQPVDEGFEKFLREFKEAGGYRCIEIMNELNLKYFKGSK